MSTKQERRNASIEAASRILENKISADRRLNEQGYFTKEQRDAYNVENARLTRNAISNYLSDSDNLNKSNPYPEGRQKNWAGELADSVLWGLGKAATSGGAAVLRGITPDHTKFFTEEQRVAANNYNRRLKDNSLTENPFTKSEEAILNSPVYRTDNTGQKYKVADSVIAAQLQENARQETILETSGDSKQGIDDVWGIDKKFGRAIGKLNEEAERQRQLNKKLAKHNKKSKEELSFAQEYSAYARAALANPGSVFNMIGESAKYMIPIIGQASIVADAAQFNQETLNALKLQTGNDFLSQAEKNRADMATTGYVAALALHKFGMGAAVAGKGAVSPLVNSKIGKAVTDKIASSATASLVSKGVIATADIASVMALEGFQEQIQAFAEIYGEDQIKNMTKEEIGSLMTERFALGSFAGGTLGAGGKVAKGAKQGFDVVTGREDLSQVSNKRISNPHDRVYSPQENIKRQTSKINNNSTEADIKKAEYEATRTLDRADKNLAAFKETKEEHSEYTTRKEVANRKKQIDKEVNIINKKMKDKSLPQSERDMLQAEKNVLQREKRLIRTPAQYNSKIKSLEKAIAKGEREYELARDKINAVKAEKNIFTPEMNRGDSSVSARKERRDSELGINRNALNPNSEEFSGTEAINVMASKLNDNSTKQDTNTMITEATSSLEEAKKAKVRYEEINKEKKTNQTLINDYSTKITGLEKQLNNPAYVGDKTKLKKEIDTLRQQRNFYSNENVALSKEQKGINKKVLKEIPAMEKALNNLKAKGIGIVKGNVKNRKYKEERLAKNKEMLAEKRKENKAKKSKIPFKKGQDRYTRASQLAQKKLSDMEKNPSKYTAKEFEDARNEVKKTNKELQDYLINTEESLEKRVTTQEANLNKTSSSKEKERKAKDLKNRQKQFEENKAKELKARKHKDSLLTKKANLEDILEDTRESLKENVSLAREQQIKSTIKDLEKQIQEIDNELSTIKVKSTKEVEIEEEVKKTKENKEAKEAKTNKAINKTSTTLGFIDRFLNAAPATVINNEDKESLLKFARLLDAMKVILNSKKGIEDVADNILNGGKGYKGLKDYLKEITAAVEKNQDKEVNRLLSNLTDFAESHNNKLIALQNADINDVVYRKPNSLEWSIVPYDSIDGKAFFDDRAKTGAILKGHNSGKLISSIKREVELIDASLDNLSGYVSKIEEVKKDIYEANKNPNKKPIYKKEELPEDYSRNYTKAEKYEYSDLPESEDINIAPNRGTKGIFQYLDNGSLKRIPEIIEMIKNNALSDYQVIHLEEVASDANKFIGFGMKSSYSLERMYARGFEGRTNTLAASNTPYTADDIVAYHRDYHTVDNPSVSAARKSELDAAIEAGATIKVVRESMRQTNDSLQHDVDYLMSRGYTEVKATDKDYKGKGISGSLKGTGIFKKTSNNSVDFNWDSTVVPNSKPNNNKPNNKKRNIKSEKHEDSFDKSLNYKITKDGETSLTFKEQWKLPALSKEGNNTELTIKGTDYKVTYLGQDSNKNHEYLVEFFTANEKESSDNLNENTINDLFNEAINEDNNFNDYSDNQETQETTSENKEAEEVVENKDEINNPFTNAALMSIYDNKEYMTIKPTEGYQTYQDANNGLVGMVKEDSYSPVFMPKVIKEVKEEKGNIETLEKGILSQLEKVLTTQKNFFDKYILSKDYEYLAKLIGVEELSESNKRQLDSFIRFHLKMEESISKLVDGDKNATAIKRDNIFYKNFITDDGKIEQNTVTAITASLYSFIQNNGRKAFPDDTEITASHGVPDTTKLNPELKLYLREMGYNQQFLYQSLGREAVSLLGLKLGKKAFTTDLDEIAASMGALAYEAVNYGMERPMFKEHSVNGKKLSLYEHLIQVSELSHYSTAVKFATARNAMNLIQASKIKSKKDFKDVLTSNLANDERLKATMLYTRPYMTSHWDSNADSTVTYFNPEILDIIKASEKEKGDKNLIGSLFETQSSRKAPRLKPADFKQKKTLRAENDIPTNAAKALDKIAKYEWTLMGDRVNHVISLYDNHREAFYEMMGVVPDSVLADMHPTPRELRIADNMIKKDLLDQQIVWLKGMKDEETGSYKSYYQMPVMWVNQRFGYESTLFNSQSDLFARMLSSMKDFETTVDTTQELFNKDGTVTKHGKYLMAVAENMEGISKFLEFNTKEDATSYSPAANTVDKVMPQHYLPKFIQYMETNQDFLTAMEIVEKMNKEGSAKLTSEELNHLNKVVKQLDMNELGFGALIELNKYLTAKKNKASFDTQVYATSDGVTNGPAITQYIFGIMDNERRLMAGIIPNGHYEQYKSNSHVANKSMGQIDAYEATGSTMVEVLNKYIKPNDTNNNPATFVFEKLGLIDKNFGSRKWAKVLRTPFNYGAGLRSLRRAVNTNLLEAVEKEFYSIYADKSLKGRTERLANFENQINEYINLYNFIYTSPKAITPENIDTQVKILGYISNSISGELSIDLNKDYESILHTLVVNYNETLYPNQNPLIIAADKSNYGYITAAISKKLRKGNYAIKPVKLDLNKDLPNGAVTAIFELSNGLFGTIASEVILTTEAKYMNIRDTFTELDNKSFYNYIHVVNIIAESLGINTNRMTIEEQEILAKAVKPYKPGVASGMSNVNEDLNSRGFKIGRIQGGLEIKDTTQIVNPSNTIGFNNYNRTIKDKNKTRNITYGFSSRAEDAPGVRGGALTVQSIDAAISISTLNEFIGMNNHDSNGVSLDNISDATVLQNKQFFDKASKYSNARERLELALRPFYYMADRYNKEDLSIDSKAKIEDVFFFNYKELAGNLGNIFNLFDIEAQKLIHAYNDKYIHQYTGVDGAYELTDKDRQQIRGQLANLKTERDKYIQRYLDKSGIDIGHQINILKANNLPIDPKVYIKGRKIDWVKELKDSKQLEDTYLVDIPISELLFEPKKESINDVIKGLGITTKNKRVLSNLERIVFENANPTKETLRTVSKFIENIDITGLSDNQLKLVNKLKGIKEPDLFEDTPVEKTNISEEKFLNATSLYDYIANIADDNKAESATEVLKALNDDTFKDVKIVRYTDSKSMDLTQTEKNILNTRPVFYNPLRKTLFINSSIGLTQDKVIKEILFATLKRNLVPLANGSELNKKLAEEYKSLTRVVNNLFSLAIQASKMKDSKLTQDDLNTLRRIYYNDPDNNFTGIEAENPSISDSVERFMSEIIYGNKELTDILKKIPDFGLTETKKGIVGTIYDKVMKVLTAILINNKTINSSITIADYLNVEISSLTNGLVSFRKENNELNLTALESKSLDSNLLSTIKELPAAPYNSNIRGKVNSLVNAKIKKAILDNDGNSITSKQLVNILKESLSNLASVEYKTEDYDYLTRILNSIDDKIKDFPVYLVTDNNINQLREESLFNTDIEEHLAKDFFHGGAFVSREPTSNVMLLSDVTISSTSNDFITLVHELLHGVTTRYMRDTQRGREVFSQLEETIQEIKQGLNSHNEEVKRLRKENLDRKAKGLEPLDIPVDTIYEATHDIRYSLSNPDEIISQYFTIKSLRDFYANTQNSTQVTKKLNDLINRLGLESLGIKNFAELIEHISYDAINNTTQKEIRESIKEANGKEEVRDTEASLESLGVNSPEKLADRISEIKNNENSVFNQKELDYLISLIIKDKSDETKSTILGFVNLDVTLTKFNNDLLFSSFNDSHGKELLSHIFNYDIKTVNKGYEDLILAITKTVLNNLKNKPTESNYLNAPIAANPIVNNKTRFSPTEIYDSLSTGTSNPALDNVVNTIVNPLMEAISPELIEGYEYEKVWHDAIVNGKNVVSSKAHNAGFVLSNQESYVLEVLETALNKGFDDTANTAIYRQLERVYKKAKDNITPQSFYDGNWEDATGEEKIHAHIKYEYLFKPEYTGGKSNYLAQFTALALVNKEVQDVLSINVDKVSTDKPITEIMIDKFGDLVEWADSRASNTPSSYNLNNQIGSLAEELAEVYYKNRDLAVQEEMSVMKKAEDFMEDMSDKLVQTIKSSTRKTIEATGLDNTKAGRIVSNALDTEYEQYERVVNDIADNFRENRPLGEVGNIFNEIAGTLDKDEHQGAKDLFYAGKFIESERRRVIDAISKTLNNSFAKENRDRSDATIKATTNVLLRTDIQSLLSTYNYSDVIGLIRNKNNLNNAISELESKVGNLQHGKEYIYRTKALGYYMVHRKATNNMLAKNALGIANRIGLKGINESVEPSERAVKLIDNLATLYALQETSPKERELVLKLIDAEAKYNTNPKDGIETTILSHKDFIRESVELFKDNPYSQVKGYVPNIFNPMKGFKVVDKSEIELHQEMGYELAHSVYSSSLDSDKTNKVLMTISNNGMERYVSGAISLEDTIKSGTEIYGRFDKATKAVTAKNRKEFINDIKMGKDNRYEAKGYLVPSYDQDGHIISYSYEMSNYGLDTILERNNNSDTLLAQFKGANLNKRLYPEHNKRIIDYLNKQYQEADLNNEKKFIEISPDHDNARNRELWNSLSKETQEYIKEANMQSVIHVRNDELNLLFGYKKLGLTEIFNKEYEQRNIIEKIYAGTFKAIFGEQAQLRSNQAVSFWMDTIKLLKDFVVIRGYKVLLANIISNIGLLMVNKTAPLDMVKDISTALTYSLKYQRDRDELASTAHLSQINPYNKDLKSRQAELKDAIERNPLKDFIESGMMPTIVNDASLLKNEIEFSSGLSTLKDNTVGRLPEGAQKAFNTLTIGQDTSLYKFLSNATQQSDFVFKYAIYQQELRSGKTKQEAMNMARKVFIEYDIPTSRGMQFINDMGFWMFTKFSLRIARVLAMMLQKKPVKIITESAFIADILNTTPLLQMSFASKFTAGGYNPIGLPIKNVLEMYENTLPYQLVKDVGRMAF